MVSLYEDHIAKYDKIPVPVWVETVEDDHKQKPKT